MSIAMRSARRPPHASPRSSSRPAPNSSMAGSSADRRARAIAGRRFTPRGRRSARPRCCAIGGSTGAPSTDRSAPLRGPRCPMPGSPRASPRPARRRWPAPRASGAARGGPPREGYSGPAIYASGPAVGETKVLRDWGLDWRAIDGPIGAASGLKMSYAGITKGITALGSAMMLGAARFGCAEALVAELSSSQPQIFGYLKNSVPRMYDKAYRWVAEMEEISDFLGANPPSRDIYAAIARLYDFLAAAEAEEKPGPDNAVKTLDGVLGRSAK